MPFEKFFPLLSSVAVKMLANRKRILTTLMILTMLRRRRTRSYVRPLNSHSTHFPSAPCPYIPLASCSTAQAWQIHKIIYYLTSLLHCTTARISLPTMRIYYIDNNKPVSGKSLGIIAKLKVVFIV